MARMRPLVGSMATTVPFMLPRASMAAWRTTGSSPAVMSPSVMSDWRTNWCGSARNNGGDERQFRERRAAVRERVHTIAGMLVSVTLRDLECVVECDESERGFTLAAMPLASNMIANAIKIARRNDQNFTFTPIPGGYTAKNCVTLHNYGARCSPKVARKKQLWCNCPIVEDLAVRAMEKYTIRNDTHTA